MTLLSEEEMDIVFSRWQAQNPAPASELNYVNPFTLLVAVVLSAQATDKSVKNEWYTTNIRLKTFNLGSMPVSMHGFIFVD